MRQWQQQQLRRDKDWSAITQRIRITRVEFTDSTATLFSSRFSMAEFEEDLPHNGLMDGIASGVGVPVEALRLLLTILAGKMPQQQCFLVGTLNTRSILKSSD